jgi:hypothetical protein
MNKSAMVLATLLVASAASADAYRPPKSETRAWRFDNELLLVEFVVDAEDMTPGDLSSVKRFVRIIDGGQVVAELDHVGFDVLTASPNASLFVGLSNQGEDPTRVVAFDRQGRVLLQVTEGAALFDYCSESVTYVRVWHGSKAEDVHFEEGDFLPGVTLLDCRGKRVNLVETVSAALARFPREYRAAKAREKAAGQ